MSEIKIRANALEIGKEYSMSLYCDKNKKIKVKVVRKPSYSIKCMTDDDEVVVASENREYVFKRNTSLPFFLVTTVNGKKTRAVFYSSEEMN